MGQSEQTDTARYTSTLPDGTRLTMDHMRAGDLAMLYVGRWPYDTVFAEVLDVRHRVLVRFEEGTQTPEWISRKRFASLLRPVQ